MDIDGLFRSKVRHLADFAKTQTLLYRHNASFHDYFHPLQMGSFTGERASLGDPRQSNRFRLGAFRTVNKIGTESSRHRIKTDVLICPIQQSSRKTETQFFIRTVLGVAGTGAKVLCLIPYGYPCRAELDARLLAAGRSGQVEFLDVTAPLSRVEARLIPGIARMRGRAAFEDAVQILGPYGLSPEKDLVYHFEHRARYVEAWENLEPWIEFDSAVVRCHWQGLGSSLCRTALERGKPLVTFQQGVIGHTLDVPVTATKYVSFGASSASFLADANRRFFQSTESHEPSVEFIKGGCLFDTVFDLRDQFDLRTLLLVDVPAAQGDFYGIDEQCSALLHLAERLLTADLPLRRIVIRPHPFWSDLDFDACQRLIREHPERCELSHPSWSLEDDLRRSSIVAGIFSGVLTVSSACGLPTVFLQTENGYSTGDLECFWPGQTLLPDAAFCEIRRVLTDARAYATAEALALKNAREYYADGSNFNFSAASFERLLRVEKESEAQGRRK
jgi:hypothetical protein